MDGDIFVHVFDDSSYSNVLEEVDTIRDFVDYLSDKEKLFNSGVRVSAASENELLACHLSGLIDGDRSAFYGLTQEMDNADTIILDEGKWLELMCSSKYLNWKKQTGISYFWDSLLQKTFYYIENGQSITTTPTIEAQSKLFQYLAREDRLHRASLSHAFLSFVSDTPDNYRGTRVGSNDPTICYVLFLLPRKEYMEEDSYRKLRIDMLRDYCLIAKSERPNVNMVIGIAHESNEALGSSEDFMTLDAGEWSAEDQNHAVELKQEYMRLGLIGKRSYTGCSYHSTHDPTIRRMKGKDRNKPCPCGSGEKYKKCCGKIR